MRDRDGSTVCAVSFVLAVTLLLKRLSLIDSVCRVSVRRGTHRQQYRWFATLNDGPVVPSCYDSLSVWRGRVVQCSVGHIRGYSTHQPGGFCVLCILL